MRFSSGPVPTATGPSSPGALAIGAGSTERIGPTDIHRLLHEARMPARPPVLWATRHAPVRHARVASRSPPDMLRVQPPIAGGQGARSVFHVAECRTFRQDARWWTGGDLCAMLRRSVASTARGFDMSRKVPSWIDLRP